MKIIEIIKKWFQNNKKTKVKMISEGQTKSIAENKEKFIGNIDLSNLPQDEAPFLLLYRKI